MDEWIVWQLKNNMHTFHILFGYNKQGRIQEFFRNRVQAISKGAGENRLHCHLALRP